MPLQDLNKFGFLTQMDSQQAQTPSVAPLPQGADLNEGQDDVSVDADIASATQHVAQVQQRLKSMAQAAQDETTFERSAESSAPDPSLAGNTQSGARWSQATGMDQQGLSTDVQSLQQTLDDGSATLGDNLSSGFSDMVDPLGSLDGLTAAFYALDVNRFSDSPQLPDVDDQARDDSERDAAIASAEAASRAQVSARRSQSDESSSALRQRSFIAKFDAVMPDVQGAKSAKGATEVGDAQPGAQAKASTTTGGATSSAAAAPAGSVAPALSSETLDIKADVFAEINTPADTDAPQTPPTPQGRAGGADKGLGNSKPAAADKSSSSASDTRTVNREIRASDAFQDPVDPIATRGDTIAHEPIACKVLDKSEAPDISTQPDASETSGGSKSSNTADGLRSSNTAGASKLPKPQARTPESKAAGVSDADVKKAPGSEDHAVVAAIGEEDSGSAQKKADTHAQHRALFAESKAMPATSTASAQKPDEKSAVAEGDEHEGRAATSETPVRSTTMFKAFAPSQSTSKASPFGELKEQLGTSNTSETKSEASDKSDQDLEVSSVQETGVRPNNLPVQDKRFSENSSDSSSTADANQDTSKVDAIGQEDSASAQRKASTQAQHRALFAAPEGSTPAAPSTRAMPQAQPKPASDKGASTSSSGADTIRSAEEQSAEASSQKDEGTSATQDKPMQPGLLFKSNIPSPSTSQAASKTAPEQSASETSEGRVGQEVDVSLMQQAVTRPNHPPVHEKGFSQHQSESSGTADTQQLSPKLDKETTEAREERASTAQSDENPDASAAQPRDAAKAPAPTNSRQNANTAASPKSPDGNKTSPVPMLRSNANAASSPTTLQAHGTAVASTSRQSSAVVSPPPPAVPQTPSSSARPGANASTTTKPRESVEVSATVKPREGADASSTTAASREGAGVSTTVKPREGAGVSTTTAASREGAGVSTTTAASREGVGVSTMSKSRESADASIKRESVDAVGTTKPRAGAEISVSVKPRESIEDVSAAAQSKQSNVSISTPAKVSSATDRNVAASKARDNATPATKALSLIDVILGVEQTAATENVSSPTVSPASEQAPRMRGTHREPATKVSPLVTGAVSSSTSSHTGWMTPASARPSLDISSSSRFEVPRPYAPRADDKRDHEENPRLAMPGRAMPDAASTAALDPLRGTPLTLSTSAGVAMSTSISTSMGVAGQQDPQSDDAAGVKSTSSGRGDALPERDDDIVSSWPTHVAGPSTRTSPPRAPLNAGTVAVDVDAAALEQQRQWAKQSLQKPSKTSDQDSTKARDALAEQQKTIGSAAPVNTKSTSRRTTQGTDSEVRVQMRSQLDEDGDQRVQPVAAHQTPRVRITQPANLAGFGAMRISNSPPAGMPQPVLLMLAADIYRMQNARQDKLGDKELAEEDQDAGVATLKAPNKKDATRKSGGAVQGIVAGGVTADDQEEAKAPHIALRAAIMTSALQQPTQTMSMFVMSDETPAVRFFIRDDEGKLQPKWIQKPADPDNEDAMFSIDPWIDFAESAWSMVYGTVEPSAEVADNTALAVKAMETLLGSSAVVQPVAWNSESRLEQARKVYDVARETNDPFYTPTLAVTDAQVDPRDGLLPSHVYGVVAFYVEADRPHVIVLEAPSSDGDDQASFRLFAVPYQAFCRSVRALVTALPDANSEDEAQAD